jgi:uncharacterized membrane protein
MLGGVLIAHWLAYRLVVHEAAARESGHRYLSHAPVVLVLLLLAGFAVRVAAPGGRQRAWPFAVLPACGFVLQEELEAILHAGRFAPLDPVLLAGILLAVPFGLAAYLFARAAATLADRLAARLRPPQPFVRRGLRRLVPPPRAIALRRPELALSRFGRGPPVTR